MFNAKYLSVISKISITDPEETCEHYVLCNDYFSHLLNSPTDVLHSDACNEHSIYMEFFGNYTLIDYNNGHNLGLCPHICKIVCRNVFSRTIKLRFDRILFSYMIKELKSSANFRRNLLQNVYHVLDRKFLSSGSFLTVEEYGACKTVIWTVHVIMKLVKPPRQILDSLWNHKINVLVNERCELECAMAWLSTLGGAFSSLGDTDLFCAKQAGVISMQQLKIAMRLGDPLTVCQCKLYLAMSLLQRGYYRTAKTIIKETYDFFITSKGENDFRLRNMCIAVWNRLKYVKSQMKLENAGK